MYGVLAELTVLVHLGFIIYVIFGGLLAIRWPRSIWVHLPVLIWGVGVELTGWVCPLTPLENHFRAQAALQGYQGGFIEHYLIAVIYPAGLTRQVQIGLGAALFAFNIVIYAVIWRAARAQRGRSVNKPAD